MSKLLGIKDTVQEIAEAITAALGIETEIIDDELNIVGGTGRYKKKIGQKEEDGNLEAGYIYGEALQTGKAYVIEEVQSHPTYDPKENELAEVCCPIVLGGSVIGLMGLIAFNEKQKQKLLENKESFLLFLQRMAYLVATKVSETEISNEMKAILQSIYDGIIAVDHNGTITSINHMGKKLLGQSEVALLGRQLTELWPDSPVMEVIATGVEVKDREEITQFSKGKLTHFLATLSPIFSGEDRSGEESKGKTVGAVVSFRDIEDVRRMVYNMTEQKEKTSFYEILGVSDAIHEIKQKGEKIAESNSTVLITGESGTGKGLFARTIHFSSPRKKGPFVTVNCGAIPDTLLESELFGYEEGAFTGAKKTGKVGKFELANGGTIFLDEIGDMPLHLQVKLLHVLQQREIQRVGGTRSIPVNVRVIAATNRNLEQMIAENEFREDLYFRLNVIPLYIPALRERKEDIPILLENALVKYNELTGKKICGFNREVMELLLNYQWRGNVRELENVVEYGVTMETGNIICMDSMPARLKNTKNKVQKNLSLKEQCGIYEKQIIEDCLKETGYSLEGKIKAAKLLQISESTLYRRIKELGISSIG